ncbi:unnamed protein product [Sphagnum balticum]
MLNGNIFGLMSVSYLSFIQFMDFTQMSIFSDFTPNWYALVSPYYLNMIIIAALVSPFVSLVVFALKHYFTHWKVRRACEHNDKEDPFIQKEANHKITENEFSYAEELSQVYLYLSIAVLYSGLIPLTVPLLCLALIVWYFVKRAIVVKFSVRIPADEALNDSSTNLIPFIILAHALFSLWSHTAPGLFASGAPLVSFRISFFGGTLDRAFGDVIMLGEAALILLFIVLDYTVFSLVGCLSECCRNELDMPTQFKDIGNAWYSNRLRKTNILGSYKLVNNPKYGHAIKAYK